MGQLFLNSGAGRRAWWGKGPTSTYVKVCLAAVCLAKATVPIFALICQKFWSSNFSFLAINCLHFI